MELAIGCDLRSMFGPVRDQGPRPTCLAFAVSDAHAASRPIWESLSCEFAYFHAIRRDGYSLGSGTTMNGMLAAIRDDGQPPEPVWPYSNSAPNASSWKPPADAKPLYRRNSLQGAAALPGLLGLLDHGKPVVITMTISDAFYRPVNGIVAATEPTDPSRKHGVIAVGHAMYETQKFVLIRNSWGEAWGESGYAWLSEEYLGPRLIGFAEMREDLTDVPADSNR